MAQSALSTAIEFALPPILHNERGEMRMVGVEIEFVGPSAEKTVQALQEALGGRLIEEDPHAFALKESAVGDLTVELDSRILHPGKQTGTQRGVLPKIAALFGFAASYLVPCELVTAPTPIDRLEELNPSWPSCAGSARRAHRMHPSMPSACISTRKFRARMRPPSPPS